ncbi:hypothetical protein J5N97_015300 [Dioscorea zingiberensis]|uniref:Uncharacterized protein n=1 Tax=Dioscorea zingiberensis TaxID=325984 RepID=A0A9D5CUF8_9LILI|nr:hypothetical protein J5N97_015300 [Dioscorea zingiberensis]
MTSTVFPLSPFRLISTVTMGCTQSTTGATVGEAAGGLSSTVSLRPPSIISMVDGDATTLHSPSFNSLRAALDNISQLKDEVSSNLNLVYFFKKYLNNSIDTLRLFTAVKDPLQKARMAELLVRDAVILFEEGSDPQAALEKLREFKEEGDPFTEIFGEEFMIVVEHHKSILDDLRLRKQELDQKLCRIKAWRKVWNIIYSMVFAAVLICAVALAAVAAPPAATAAAAAVSSAMAPLQQWVGSIWDQFQSPYEGEKDVIDSLKKSTKLAIHELNSIRVLVGELEIKIRSTIHSAEFAIEEGEEAALKDVMRELKAGTSAKSAEDLEKEVDRGGAKLKTAITAILEKVAN